MTVSTLPRPEEIFTWVGKVAPPMPTMPASFTRAEICSGVRASGSLAGTQSGQGVSLKSFSITTLMTGTPEKWMRFSTADTVPETLAWTGAETKAGASPTFCPTVTWSPTDTQGVQGAPMCRDMGITTRAGGGRVSMGFLLVAALWSLGWMPPKKACAIGSPHSRFSLARFFQNAIILPFADVVQMVFVIFSDFFVEYVGKSGACLLIL